MWLLVAVSLASLPPQVMAVVVEETKKYNFDPLLVAAVIHKETKFKNWLCFRGSHGLMQIQLNEGGKRTCKDTMESAVAQGLYDPRTNIQRGLKLMKWWKSWWKKHPRHLEFHWLLFYNQGFGRCPGGRKKCGKQERVPVRTGRRGNYAKSVLRIYRELKRGGEV